MNVTLGSLGMDTNAQVNSLLQEQLIVITTCQNLKGGDTLSLDITMMVIEVKNHWLSFFFFSYINVHVEMPERV